MCSAIFRLVFAALCIVGAEAALAQTTSWTDGTGDWFNANNWSAGVPDSSHAAYINNGGTAQLAANGGTISGILLGMNAVDSGALSISGAGNLTTDNSVEVGQSGTGLLEITSGGDLSVSRFLIGTNTGSHGTITVSGIGSTLSGSAAVSFIGFNGTATLNVLSGAVASTLNSVSVGENGSSNGTVTIDGAGSKWTVGGFLTISGNGTASLSITNGGYVSTGGAEIARNPGGNATVTVLGGSTWANFGPLVVSDGFAVSSGSLQIASGSSVSDTYSIVGGAGGHGTVTVEGMGTAWTHSSDLTVGSDQGNGTLSITNGATVSNSRGYIGFNGFGSGQSVGMVTVDGTGSKWTNSASLYIGGSESGAGGSGVLRIQNGGTVSAAATTVWSKGTLEIGSTASLSGPLTFSGGKLRFVADASFANDATLGTGGLTVDSNGFSSSLSGKLSGSAALTKTGNGTTALSGANTYTGGTTVNSGMLLVNNSTGSGTGTSTVQVSAGKLGGTGTIAGAVTVGTGSGAGASISPGMSVGALTIQSSLTLNSDATFTFELNSSTGLADKIAANGVTINGAQFSFTDLGSGQLAAGTTFVIIDNTSVGSIGGTFSNLADSSIFASNGNMYRVSYSGSDGNDMTLTVVPEPAAWTFTVIGLLPVFALRSRSR